jgi:hypothetical protein
MTAPACRDCGHFTDDPAAIERLCKGLTAMSSAYGSTRAEDGICALHDLHVAAGDGCAQFKSMRPGR